MMGPCYIMASYHESLPHPRVAFREPRLSGSQDEWVPPRTMGAACPREKGAGPCTWEILQPEHEVPRVRGALCTTTYHHTAEPRQCGGKRGHPSSWHVPVTPDASQGCGRDWGEQTLSSPRNHPPSSWAPIVVTLPQVVTLPLPS